jgi:hypothetical protein
MKKILKKTIILISILTLGVAAPTICNAQEVAESEYEQITGPRYGEDSVNCVLNLSLYREFYRQWRLAGGTGTVIEDAIRPWRWVFLNCPLASQNVYIDGVAIVEYLIAKENTPEKKKNSLIH